MSLSEPVSHPIFARLFARLVRMEGRVERAHRVAMLDGVAGRIVEVGAGSGANFAHYGPGVTEVIAVEPEPYMRGEAAKAAATAPVPVRVVEGTADHLPVGNGEADAVVFSLVLCSVADQARALAEARRVLRPGGEVRFFEHVAAEPGALARAQRVLDATVWPRAFGGCHTHRDTAGAIRDAGFTMERCDSIRVMPCALALPVAPHVIGIARRD